MLNRKVQKKVKVSFVLPKGLHQEMKERMIKDGYDLKGKSRWVSEAVELLLQMDTYPELVKLNDEMSGFEKLESVLIPKSLKGTLDGAVLNIRKKYMTLEGIQSMVFRTAIMQRILA